MVRSWHVANLTVAVLLAWAAYWAALPWLDCIRAFHAIVPIGEPLRLCTFGFGLPGFQGPLGWTLLAGVLYVAAASWAAACRRRCPRSWRLARVQRVSDWVLRSISAGSQRGGSPTASRPSSARTRWSISAEICSRVAMARPARAGPWAWEGRPFCCWTWEPRRAERGNGPGDPIFIT